MPIFNKFGTKFGFALNGISEAFRYDNTFKFHFAVAAIVLGVSAFLRLSAVEWVLILMAIGLVFVAEMVNTAFEILCRYVTDRKFHDAIKKVLDIAAGGVLLTSITAVAIGVLILGPKILAIAAKLLLSH